MFVNCYYGREKSKMLSNYFVDCYTTDSKNLILKIKFTTEEIEYIGITQGYYLIFKTILKRYSQNRLKDIPSFRFSYYDNDNEYQNFAKAEKVKINKKYYLVLTFEQEEKDSIIYLYLNDVACEIISDYMQIKQKEVFG